MTFKIEIVYIFIFSGTVICSGLREALNAPSNQTFIDSINSSGLPKFLSSSSMNSIKESEFLSSTPVLRQETLFLFRTLLKAPTTNLPKLMFRRSTEPPDLLLGGLISSLDFVDERDFIGLRQESPRRLINESASNDIKTDHRLEELKHGDPRIVSNETGFHSFTDDNRIETSINGDSNRNHNKTGVLLVNRDHLITNIGHLTNKSTEMELDHKETMADAADSVKGIPQFMSNSTKPKLIEMKFSKTDQTQIQSQNSAIFYGKVTSLDVSYKYLYPSILGLCLLTTFALVLSLVRKNRQIKSQMGKASCVLLITIAVADSITMGFALAETSYRFEKTEENHGFLPFQACKTMYVLERLSAVPHATSTWLTVFLAVQRYLCVSRPFSAGKYITLKTAWISVWIICLLSIALHIYRFFDFTFVSVNVRLNDVTIASCYAVYANWVTNPHLYESVFAWSRILLMQFLPSVMIVSFVVLMIHSLRQAEIKTNNRNMAENTRNVERRKLTFFVAVIALIVVSVETSSGLFLCFNAWELTTGQTLITYDALKTASVAFDLILYISYFMMFVLYCLMSKDLRRRITRCCIPRITLRGNGERASGKSSKLASRRSALSSISKGSGQAKNGGNFNHHVVTKL